MVTSERTSRGKYWHWIAARIPGAIIIAIAILSLTPNLPQYRAFEWAQVVTPRLAEVVFGFLGVLLLVVPDKVFMFPRITTLEITMRGRERDLLQREQRISDLEETLRKHEDLLNGDRWANYVDFGLKQIFWEGLREEFVPYVELEIVATSRLLLELTFDGREQQCDFLMNNVTIARSMRLSSSLSIPKLDRSDLKFRIAINSDVKRSIIQLAQDKQAPTWTLNPSWKLTSGDTSLEYVGRRLPDFEAQPAYSS